MNSYKKIYLFSLSTSVTPAHSALIQGQARGNHHQQETAMNQIAHLSLWIKRHSLKHGIEWRGMDE